MTLHRLHKSALLALACCSFALLQHNAIADEGIFIQSAPAPANAAQSAHEAASFDSAYAAEERKNGGGGGTPESDARPGTYYFMEGAYAYRKKDYDFAIQMYQVSASWAYKPAEYNIAVMYARGQGVAVDLPRAMAWMALAAERNEPRYVDAREAVYASLTKEQFEQANMIWRELKKTYGDEVALRRAKARWAQVKSSMTGSRVGSVGNLSVGTPNPNGGDPSSAKRTIVPPGVTYVRTTASSAAEVTMGTGVDGSIAYHQLRESDNPYDPKFQTSALGRATVGEPTTLKDSAPKDATKDLPKNQPDQPDPEKHER
jgi:tetratricopeptide (TPR) repeat protein